MLFLLGSCRISGAATLSLNRPRETGARFKGNGKWAWAGMEQTGDGETLVP